MKICEMCDSTVLRDKNSFSPIGAVGVALGDQLEYVALAVGQLVERTALGACERPGARRSWGRSRTRHRRCAAARRRARRGPTPAPSAGSPPVRAPPRAAASRSATRGGARGRGRRSRGAGGGSPAPRRRPSSPRWGGMRMSTSATSGRRASTIRNSAVGVATAPRDLEAGVFEQASEALAQQHLVVGDHDSHGSSARR